MAETAIRAEVGLPLSAPETEEAVHWEVRMSRGERILSRLRQRDAFEIDGVSLRFSDSSWDLSAAMADPGLRSRTTLGFEDVGEFTEIVKLYCYDRLANTDLSIETIYGHLRAATLYFKRVRAAGHPDVSAVPYSFYVEHYGEPLAVSYRTHIKEKSAVRLFLEFYESNFGPLADRRCLKLLRHCDDSRSNAETQAGKRDVIEQGYLEELLCTCMRVARDVVAHINDRIIACCLLIYSQIGCRTSELGTFKVDGLGKVEGGGRGPDLWFAKFKYAKRKGSRTDWEPTTCYMNDVALEAFRILEEICRPSRTAAASDALVVFSNGGSFSVSAFTDHYHEFIVRNLGGEPYLNVSDQRNGMHTVKAGDAVRQWLKRESEKGVARTLRELGLSEDDVISYPEVRMFRNTVCTGLYLQKKSLTWIRRHLNHLCKDMEAYYNRADRKIDEEFSNEVYRSVITEGARIIGPNSDGFGQAIQSFLESKKLLSRIESDPEGVVRKLAKNLPLKKKHGGMCIRCAGIVPCAVDGLTDEIVCALGVCPNHCSTYWMAASSYADAEGAVLVVKANVERGRMKEAQHELSKLRRIIEERLSPELAELVSECGRLGEALVVGRHPELEPIVENMDAIMEEVEEWKNWTI